MWIFTKYGFFSIVYKNNAVNVRTRIADFLDKLHEKFPELQKYPIVQIDHQDYQYRILVPQHVWDIVKDDFFDIDYSNFKSEVAKVWGHNHHYTELLHKLWTALYKYWDILENGEPKGGAKSTTIGDTTYSYDGDGNYSHYSYSLADQPKTTTLPVTKHVYESKADPNAETVTPYEVNGNKKKETVQEVDVRKQQADMQSDAREYLEYM